MQGLLYGSKTCQGGHAKSPSTNRGKQSRSSSCRLTIRSQRRTIWRLWRWNGSGNQRQPQAPPRPTQPKSSFEVSATKGYDNYTKIVFSFTDYNICLNISKDKRDINDFVGLYICYGSMMIPSFPGSVGSGDLNMSYIYIFDYVKEERREEAKPYGRSVRNNPSRPINGQHESTAPNFSKVLHIIIWLINMSLLQNTITLICNYNL